jgi:hypothetical protein
MFWRRTDAFTATWSEIHEMTWLKATCFGMLIGAGCGILLAMPVVLINPLSPIRFFDKDFRIIGGWAVGGAICGIVVSQVIFLFDLNMLRLPITNKRLSHSRRYWQTSFGVLCLAAFASLIPFWQSYVATGHIVDASVVVGWPYHFFSRVDSAYIDRCDLGNLMVDVAIWTSLAVVAAYLVRKGKKRLSVRLLLLLRNALGANRRVRD